MHNTFKHLIIHNAANNSRVIEHDQFTLVLNFEGCALDHNLELVMSVVGLLRADCDT